MADNRFTHLFSPLSLRGVTIRNRIMSTGHETAMATRDGIGDDIVAYHQARAAGGAGLIVVEVAMIHPSAVFTRCALSLTSDDCIPGYRRVAEACHQHGTAVFAQLFHPGREIINSYDGTAPVSYAPSATPNERFRVMPAPMSRQMIGEVIAGYGDGARRVQEAGLDGVEIVASHGYLPSQFLNPRVNTRDDEYGGSLENRLRFFRDVIADIRAKVSRDFIVGLRISGDEKSLDGLREEEALEACIALDEEEGLDYFNIIAGSSSTLAGSIHIVPPMTVDNNYVAPAAEAIKAAVGKPVFVGGRINRPEDAERIIASGQADMCGMTRAMICDSEMANKAMTGRAGDIRACIACNQACIGHFLQGYPISCIQHPESGRELEYGSPRPAAKCREILVAGGGPAGMKAAAVAAARGHQVTLFESGPRLGGQALLAQLLPGRDEFGGIVANLAREMELADVTVVTNTTVDMELIKRQAPGAVIVATGARPRRPDLEEAWEGEDEAHIVDAWQVLKGEAKVGQRVVVADWRSDWIGLGLAEKLAREGCHVRLCVNANMPGMAIQQYVRDGWIGRLHKLGVEIIPLTRLFGADADTVYMQHTLSGEPVICGNVDTLVLSQGHQPVNDLAAALADYKGQVHAIGDCVSPRTCEEAVFEGLKAGWAV